MLDATVYTPALPNFDAPVSTQTLDPVDRAIYAEAFVQRWECENTRRSYLSDLEVLFAWCDSRGLDVFAVHRMHLQVFMRYLADERDNCATTILHRMSTIAQFYELAVDDSLCGKNPTRLLKLPKRPTIRSADRALTPREFERLVWAAADAGPVDYALVLIMGVCGLRVSPTCSLDVETATVLDQAHRMLVFTNKGGETMAVPQPPIVVQAVDRVIDGRTTGPLLPRNDGSRMTRQSAAKILTRLKRHAGITRRLTPHDLRHTFAVTSLESGVPLEAVALSMGHKDSSTTYRHYGRRTIANNQHSAHIVAGSIQVPNL
ncbi:tyrosine-type recombinase/integrase [Rhodococcoides kyotonense]|uniref:Site-specific recombinase XerD n=1 Tax=Rhodococcoides kyotonense TaxID=398843 RepID=A0A239FN14_9NOCA|nr:tyrosine-type recombinase/integrase [Rhodococcus kyotonensis]SNS58269.1 Site-specific recombinase XerD [Rhodococcus kyotonensis]